MSDNNWNEIKVIVSKILDRMILWKRLIGGCMGSGRRTSNRCFSTWFFFKKHCTNWWRRILPHDHRNGQTSKISFYDFSSIWLPSWKTIIRWHYSPFPSSKKSSHNHYTSQDFKLFILADNDNTKKVLSSFLLNLKTKNEMKKLR